MNRAKLTLAEYQNIEELGKRLMLNEAFQAMISIPVLQVDGNLLLDRYTEYLNHLHYGLITSEQLNLEFEQIVNAFWSRLKAWDPSKLASSSQSQTSEELPFTYINSSKHPLLNANPYFIGRKKEVKEMMSNLKMEEFNAFLVTGEGGIGKTDFCRKVLQIFLAENQEIKAIWINVEGIETADELQAILAKIVGLPENSDLASIRVKIHALGPILVYIDNLESIYNNRPSSETNNLLKKLRSTEGTIWLASSRERSQAWRVFPLPELDPKDAEALFAEEWNQSGGYPLPEPFPRELRAFILDELGNHPLSIVITASQGVYYPTYHEVLQDWKKGEDRIGQRRGMKKDRTSSLDFSIRLSMQRVRNTPNAIRLWTLCAFFPNGIDIETQKILFSQEALFTIEDAAILIQNSILRRRGDGRLYLLPPLSRFVFQRLKIPSSEFSEKQVFEDGMSLSSFGAPVRFEDATESWCRRITFYLKFLDHFVSRLDHFPNILELHLLMRNYYHYSPYTSREFLNRFMKTTNIPKIERANASLILGDLELKIGNKENARNYFRESERLYRELGLEIGQASALLILGELEIQLGNFNKARAFFNEGYLLFQKEDSFKGVEGRANVFRNFGYLEFLQDNYQEARKYFEKSEELYRENKDNHSIAEIFLKLGTLELRFRNSEMSIHYFVKAFGLYKETGDTKGMAKALLGMGERELQLNNLQDARRYFEKAYGLFEKNNDLLGKANSLTNIGDVEFRFGDYDRALQTFREAQGINVVIGNRYGEARYYLFKSKFELLTLNYNIALEFLNKAITIFKRLSNNFETVLALLQRVEIYLALTNVQAALSDVQYAKTLVGHLQIDWLRRDIENKEEDIHLS